MYYVIVEPSLYHSICHACIINIELTSEITKYKDINYNNKINTIINNPIYNENVTSNIEVITYDSNGTTIHDDKQINFNGLNKVEPMTQLVQHYEGIELNNVKQKPINIKFNCSNNNKLINNRQLKTTNDKFGSGTNVNSSSGKLIDDSKTIYINTNDNETLNNNNESLIDSNSKLIKNNYNCNNSCDTTNVIQMGKDCKKMSLKRTITTNNNEENKLYRKTNNKIHNTRSKTRNNNNNYNDNHNNNNNYSNCTKSKTYKESETLEKPTNTNNKREATCRNKNEQKQKYKDMNCIKNKKLDSYNINPTDISSNKSENITLSTNNIDNKNTNVTNVQITNNNKLPKKQVINDSKKIEDNKLVKSNALKMRKTHNTRTQAKKYDTANDNRVSINNEYTTSMEIKRPTSNIINSINKNIIHSCDNMSNNFDTKQISNNTLYSHSMEIKIINNKVINNNHTHVFKNNDDMEDGKINKYNYNLINEPRNEQKDNLALVNDNYNENINEINVEESNKLLILHYDNEHISNELINDDIKMSLNLNLNAINNSTTTIRRSDRLKRKQEYKFNLPMKNIIQNEYKLNNYKKRKKKGKEMENIQKTCDNHNDIQKQQTQYQSALAEHIIKEKHNIDWMNSKIICNDNNPEKLLIKESLMIKAMQPEFNRTTRSTPLYIFPEGLSKRYLPKRIQQLMN